MAYEKTGNGLFNIDPNFLEFTELNSLEFTEDELRDFP